MDGAGVIGARAGVGCGVVCCRFDRSPGLLGLTFDLLGCAFVGEIFVMGGFADGLLYLASHFVELALQFAFSSSAHSPFPSQAGCQASACVTFMRPGHEVMAGPRL